LILFWNKYIFYKKKEKAKVIILSILAGRPSSSNPPAEFASPRPVAFVRSERHFISILKKSTYWPMVIYTCSITYRILWCAQFGGDVLETLKIQQAASPRVRIVVGRCGGASQLGKLIPVNWCDGASYVRNNNRTHPSSCNERALEQYGPRKRRAYYIHRRLASFKKKKNRRARSPIDWKRMRRTRAIPDDDCIVCCWLFRCGGQTKKSIERRELFALFVGIVPYCCRCVLPVPSCVLLYMRVLFVWWRQSRHIWTAFASPSR
jgi:hypothetical protein